MGFPFVLFSWLSPPNFNELRTPTASARADVVQDANITHSPDQEGLGRIAHRPDRLVIVDLDDTSKNGQLMVQFNPDEFEENLKTDWARLKSPGLSHRRLHYIGTENSEVSFQLTFDALSGGMTIDQILYARRFLMSLCYPRKGATNVREGQLPRTLFSWPNFLAMICVIGELGFKYERFDVSGAPTRFTVKIKIEEIVRGDERFYLEDIRGGTR